LIGPEEIPCNPCEAACPFGAIRIPGNITARPVVDMEKCTGCSNCVTACPGQACFVIDPDFGPGEGTVDFPYEYVPLPEPGLSVQAMDNNGEKICAGQVVQVLSPPPEREDPYCPYPPSSRKCLSGAWYFADPEPGRPGRIIVWRNLIPVHPGLIPGITGFLSPGKGNFAQAHEFPFPFFIHYFRVFHKLLFRVLSPIISGPVK
jgi:NAD-dependent dihydropyrimidine dehydrogenase PreA subunit